MKPVEAVYAPDPRSPDTWRGALATHARVVGAVVMHDLQTRMGAGYWGYLLGLVMPLGHLVLVVIIYSLLSRGTPLGTDALPYMTVAVMPFVIWLYTHRQMFLALPTNRALLHFPGVTIFDLLVGRALVEVFTNTLVFVVVAGAVAVAGHALAPIDPIGFGFAIARAYLLGIATGLVFGALSFVWNGALLAGSLMGPLYWITCGTFFLPTSLPEQARQALAFFPLTHIVDEARLAYYSEYTSDFSAVITSDMLIFTILAIGMFLQYAVRKHG